MNGKSSKDTVGMNPTAGILKQRHPETRKLGQAHHHHHLLSAEKAVRAVQDPKRTQAQYVTSTSTKPKSWPPGLCGEHKAPFSSISKGREELWWSPFTTSYPSHMLVRPGAGTETPALEIRLREEVGTAYMGKS